MSATQALRAGCWGPRFEQMGTSLASPLTVCGPSSLCGQFVMQGPHGPHLRLLVLWTSGLGKRENHTTSPRHQESVMGAVKDPHLELLPLRGVAVRGISCPEVRP